ncbi:Fur-regulated basic protein FbpA [Cytobacillus massiliigabonensis]|uniref:Fur-regulated basic protein FbpA n=1 Tax=Cytobacillus massiliigabonensis TaxID=1871011 RepID=UPI000C837C08|nr:Fur-regulated basic protein FbpA [Cytobacillus massiliigabonensis]
MTRILRDTIETRKDYIISKLLSVGIYKINDAQLFELRLSELEHELQQLNGKRN